MRNANLRFICRDVYLRVERSDTPFTRGYNAGQVIRVPVAHGEGNYIADGETIARLEGEGRVLFRYCSPDGMIDPNWNHNGAINAIAGIVNERGNVLGMMPHPENHVEAALGVTDGRGLFAGLARGAGAGGYSVISNEPAITPELVAEHGLKPDEYKRMLDLIGREPSLTELGIFSAMWNEHCSYKSSKVHLRTLPTKGPHVIQGPGENAGVIDIGDGLACVFKMESHNHPSYIEPYQGAATGVGGILRDVFTMGARPIACLNALSFGDPKHPKTRHLVSGVVAGIGGYGNSFGVPTVGGSVRFHARYDGNNLVNAMAVGICEKDKIFYAAASGVGMPIVYLGSKTGRDGIHGASMASAEFGEDSEAKRPTVQVGDPFSEKLLLEACLEIMHKGCVIAIQDMGAAGLTCSAVEMGAKGDLGVTLDLDKVPCREEGMSAYEMMLSESQERMLMVLKPEKEKEAEAIFRKWGLDFAIVGETTPSQTLHRAPRRRRDGRSADQGTGRPGAGIQAALRQRGQAQGDRGRGRQAADGHRRRAGKADRHARPLLQALGLGAIRPHHSRQHRAAAGRRCRGGAGRERAEGPGAHHRRDAALLRGRSVRGRQAGGGRMLAQPDRGRRQAARRHRQSQFRQSGAAGDHGPVRRLHPRHRRSLQGARFPGRVRQCLALQRDQRHAPFCRRPRSAASACSTISPSRPRSPSSAKARRSC